MFLGFEGIVMGKRIFGPCTIVLREFSTGFPCTLKSLPTFSRLIDSAGVDGLCDNEWDEACNEERNECGRMHFGCLSLFAYCVLCLEST